MTEYEKEVEAARKRFDGVVNKYSEELTFAMRDWYEQTTTYQLEKLTDLLQQINELLEKLINLPIERALDFNLEDFRKMYRGICQEHYEEGEQKP